VEPNPIWTNQGERVRIFFAEAGVTHEKLAAATKESPIHLSATNVDISIEGNGAKTIHFSKSRWRALGCTHRTIKKHDELSGPLAINVVCHVPDAGKRYSMEAVLYHDPKRRMNILAITNFTFEIELATSTVFELDDHAPANSFLNDEEPSTADELVPA
jgi:hypothetical protein